MVFNNKRANDVYGIPVKMVNRISYKGFDDVQPIRNGEQINDITHGIFIPTSIDSEYIESEYLIIFLGDVDGSLHLEDHNISS